MAQIKDLAYILRSKNAGAFYLTFDIIFRDKEKYNKVANSKVINKSFIANIYKSDIRLVHIYNYEKVNSIKISIPRKYSAGDVFDTDVFGCQQHVHLMNLEVPD